MVYTEGVTKEKRVTKATPDAAVAFNPGWSGGRALLGLELSMQMDDGSPLAPQVLAYFGEAALDVLAADLRKVAHAGVRLNTAAPALRPHPRKGREVIAEVEHIITLAGEPLQGALAKRMNGLFARTVEDTFTRLLIEGLLVREAQGEAQGAACATSA